MSLKKKIFLIVLAVFTISSLALVACQPATPEPAEPEEPEAEAMRWEEPIVIGWTPPDITGVFKTATDFFEKSAEDGNANGFDIQIISQSSML